MSGGPKDDTISKSKGRIAWFERREAEMATELAATPSVGYHKSRFWELTRALERMRRIIEDEREYLKWLIETEKVMSEFETLESMMTSGERRAWNEFRAKQNRLREEREEREREAVKRRARFRLILGGRSV
jgi:hypothetical protein